MMEPDKNASDKMVTKGYVKKSHGSAECGTQIVPVPKNTGIRICGVGTVNPQAGE